MNSQDIFIPNQKARRKLADKLNLEFDETMQDWEYEISDSSRVEEFLFEYDKENTTKKEKEALMEIILDSLNDVPKNGRNEEFDKHIDLVCLKLKENLNF